MQQVVLRDPSPDVLVANALSELVEPTPAPSRGEIEVERQVLRTLGPDCIEGVELPAASRTLVHAYVPVRNSTSEVIDFRLTFDRSTAPELMHSFVGIQMVECGPSVAPGEIFHTLKHVLESGEPQQTVTRHSGPGQEVCFYQTAVKSGDAVVTTTSIVTIR